MNQLDKAIDAAIRLRRGNCKFPTATICSIISTKFGVRISEAQVLRVENDRKNPKHGTGRAVIPQWSTKCVSETWRDKYIFPENAEVRWDRIARFNLGGQH